MLEEEKGTFSTSDDDIGCVEELELKLNMRDQIPTTLSHDLCIPKSNNILKIY